MLAVVLQISADEICVNPSPPTYVAQCPTCSSPRLISQKKQWRQPYVWLHQPSLFPKTEDRTKAQVLVIKTFGTGITFLHNSCSLRTSDNLLAFPPWISRTMQEKQEHENLHSTDCLSLNSLDFKNLTLHNNHRTDRREMVLGTVATGVRLLSCPLSSFFFSLPLIHQKKKSHRTVEVGRNHLGSSRLCS